MAAQAKHNITKLYHKRRIAAQAVCAAILGMLVLAAAAVSAPTAHAQARHASDTPVQQAVVLDSPAVVRIVSVVEARLTCAKCATDGSDIVSPAAAQQPFEYFSSGSGAFISPNGTILTADHVVDHSMQNPEEVQFVEDQAASDIAPRYTGNLPPQMQQCFDTTQTDQLWQCFNNSSVAIQFTVVEQLAFLSTAYTGQFHDLKHVYQFKVLSPALASSPPTQQDTAIIKIDTSGITPQADFPYLTLATTTPQTLDNVTAIAFPADADEELNSSADFTVLLDIPSSDPQTITDLLTPSVNPGQVTKVDPQQYEVTGIGSNGSSGGPVINDQGQVIGFVDAGTSTERITFIIPSSVIATYTQKAGAANPPAGQFMPLWSKALTEYYGTGTCHYSNAATDLTTLNKEYPDFGGDTNLTNTAKLKAAGEACAAATPAPTTTAHQGDVTAGLLLIGGCALAILAFIGAVIFFIVYLLRRRSASAKAPAPAQTYTAPPAPMYGAPPAPRYEAPPAPRPGTSFANPAPYAPPGPYGVPAPQTPQTPASPQEPTVVAGHTAWPLPAPTPAAPEQRKRSTSAPTRFCPNGHAVLEPDAAFCPLCGAPMS